MSAVLKQTHASPIHGPCRARWSYDGESFTSYGAWVPKEVMAADEILMAENSALPSDDEVLDDTSPILSPAVLPEGSTLSEPPPKVDKAKLQSIRDRLKANAAAATAAGGVPAAASPEIDVASLIELQVARREAAEREERIAAQAAELDDLRRRMAAMTAAQPAADAPPADPLAEATGAAKQQGAPSAKK